MEHDAGTQQVAVGAAAGRAHDPRIVARGQDETDLHAAPGGGAQGLEHRGVGNEVRGGDHDLAPCAGQQRGHELRGGAGPLGRAFGNDDGGKAVCRPVGQTVCGPDSQRHGRNLGDAACLRPVAGEHLLHLRHHRTLHAQHDIDPGRIAGLDGKGFIRAVLAAAVGDALVDHGDLAVVAQVQAAGEHHADRMAGGQGHGQLHARLGHLLPEVGAQQRARAQAVHHGATDHATPCRAHQRLGHGRARVISQPDVVQHVDFMLGGVHVGQHAGAGLGAIGHELRGVARLCGKAVDGGRIAEGSLPLRGDARYRHGGAVVHGSACREVLHLAGSSTMTVSQPMRTSGRTSSRKRMRKPKPAMSSRCNAISSQVMRPA
ncbi:hypothetical protein COLO4_01261 [Corchorus olitorius]|uniref:Uncharacterized protein n=1 Tax=Corchorus olitorius TaxID=93759 RepID=A0A1R3L2R9_9ROSI|nr:hypothetical protein COLO4_01261 [Corchorus olitorius]